MELPVEPSAGIKAAPRRAAARIGVAVQLLLLAAAGGVALVPPAQGTMLILPLTAASDGDSLRWATHADARLVGRGPYRGALFVAGDRARLLPHALRQGALLINAVPALCAPGSRSLS